MPVRLYACCSQMTLVSFQPSAQVKEQLQESDAEYTSHFFNVPAYLTVSGQLHLEVMSG